MARLEMEYFRQNLAKNLPYSCHRIATDYKLKRFNSFLNDGIYVRSHLNLLTVSKFVTQEKL